jgi:uncharacterized protein involved in exopolysaccharide biosynthesis
VLKMTTGDYSAESFQAYEYLDHLKRRWKLVLVVCAAAGALALIVSLILPKEYTATASIVIDPPAGNDPRGSITVSPVYLESLRAYETFASSDTLFLRAVDKFHLRGDQPSKSIESLKRSILKVAKLKDTKILQISATLSDAKQSQALAQFLAEETVALSRSSSLDDEKDLRDDARARLNEAQKRLEDQQSAWREFVVKSPYESMRADVEGLAANRERVQRDLTDSRAELAELSSSAGSNPRTAGMRARVESLEKRDAELAQQMQAKSTALSERDARSEQLEQKVHSAQVAYDAVAARVRELDASAGLRGERLRVLDPGVIPERASFPTVGLNVILAMFVALIAAGTYLTLSFRPSRA